MFWGSTGCSRTLSERCGTMRNLPNRVELWRTGGTMKNPFRTMRNVAEPVRTMPNPARLLRLLAAGALVAGASVTIGARPGGPVDSASLQRSPHRWGLRCGPARSEVGCVVEGLSARTVSVRQSERPAGAGECLRHSLRRRVGPDVPVDRQAGSLGINRADSLREHIRHAAADARRCVRRLFADLVGFTALSESRDSEEVRDVLSSYFEACRTVIARYGGTVRSSSGTP